MNVRGTTYVPDFQLKMASNPLPLSTSFEALVDGTNGNTVLRPVRATLGHTRFTTNGAVIKHEEYSKRSINLKVDMRNGDMRDLLRLAMKGSPFMQGFINMKSSIDIPPLTSKVKQKLVLDGTFDLKHAKFLKSTIQDQIDQLSRRGQGQPKNEEIDEVISKMQGSFHLENQVMTFRSLAFEVPGAAVSIAGKYNLANDMLDFHGALKLHAKLSQTMSGWKRWVLKPVDPFFAKNGAGDFSEDQNRRRRSPPEIRAGSLRLLETGLAQHFQELALGPHIDCLGGQFASAIVNETFRNALYVKKLIHFAARIQQHWIGELLFGNERFHFGGVFIGDSKDHKAARTEALVESLQIGQLLAARRTPGGPEIHEHHFAGQRA